MKKTLFISALLLLMSISTKGQIGYQVSLLNSATGEPRANENVTVKIVISNSDNTVICSEEKNATSNEFGVLSLSVGNDKTFEDVDWTKAPFYVSATIDGVLIGKSQILSVPIAETAKTLVGVSREVLEGTWGYTRTTSEGVYWYRITFSFNDNSSGIATTSDSSDKGPGSYDFIVVGNTIWLLDEFGVAEHIIFHKDKVYSEQGLLSRR